jgi:PAS domain S-box-containing protein
MATDLERENQTLRRALSDVLSVSALPTVWSGYTTEQIARNLADVLIRAVGCDAILVTLGSRQAVDVLRVADDSDAELAARLREIAASPHGSDLSVRTGGGAELFAVSYRLSSDPRDRLVAASYRPGFPADSERLLLRVAANQALTWIERKNAEEALASESMLRRGIEESMAAGVAVVDGEGRLTYVNRAFTAMVGWQESELVGTMPPFAFWAPEALDDINRAFDSAMTTGGNATYELLLRRRNGERFDALVLISRLESEDRREGFIASVYDVTDRKAVERASAFLAEASGALNRSLDPEATLQAIGALVVPRLADWCFVDLVEADGGFQRVIAAHADPAGAPVAHRLLRSYAPSRVPYGVSQTLAVGRTTLLNDVTPDLVIPMARDEDHREAILAIGIRCFLSAPMISGGRTIGVLSLVGTGRRTRFDERDVALAEELAHRAALAVDNARLYREAQEANRVKDEFLANLSHELRTPMTAILGWAHLLQLGGIDEEQMRLGIDTIRQSGQAQAKLIDELLDVSRIVTGKLHINPAPLDLCDVIRAAVAAIRPAADAKRQALLLDLTVDRLATSGDAARLQQVFWNLLSNAVKFTPPGGTIRIVVEKRDARPGAGRARITVSDTGEGIPRAFLPLVFERFKQAATVSRGRSGLGLGLAIAKDLVELHGGSIAAESEGEGRGSTFTVTLPVQRAGVIAPELDRERVPLQGRRVLLVEDDEATRTLLATILRSFGADVRAASCVADALADASTFAAEILISDIEMPGDDGIVLLHELRGRSATLPAIAVTGYADAQSRERILAAGFNGFVAKPLDPHVLATEVQRALAGG